MHITRTTCRVRCWIILNATVTRSSVRHNRRSVLKLEDSLYLCCLTNNAVVCVLGVAAIPSVSPLCLLLLQLPNWTMLYLVSPRGAVTTVIHTNTHTDVETTWKWRKKLTNTVIQLSSKQCVWRGLFSCENTNLLLPSSLHVDPLSFFLILSVFLFSSSFSALSVTLRH